MSKGSGKGSVIASVPAPTSGQKSIMGFFTKVSGSITKKSAGEEPLQLSPSTGKEAISSGVSKGALPAKIKSASGGGKSEGVSEAMDKATVLCVISS